MSIRSDILGWVIRRLGEVDAGNPAARQVLFDSLRREVAQSGFGGLRPQEALPHLESAIARQEVYWLGQQPPDPTGGTPRLPTVSGRSRSSHPPIWGWRRFLPVPRTPPGPAPGKAIGPFADHVYVCAPLIVKGQEVECQLSWSYDPACMLAAQCEAIGFSFETRAFSFRHAVAHLDRVIRRGGLVLRAAAFEPGAIWADEARDCEVVRSGQGDLVHAFAMTLTP